MHSHWHRLLHVSKCGTGEQQVKPDVTTLEAMQHARRHMLHKPQKQRQVKTQTHAVCTTLHQLFFLLAKGASCTCDNDSCEASGANMLAAYQYVCWKHTAASTTALVRQGQCIAHTKQRAVRHQYTLPPCIWCGTFYRKLPQLGHQPSTMCDTTSRLYQHVCAQNLKENEVHTLMTSGALSTSSVSTQQ